jgi:hypothetical protein
VRAIETATTRRIDTCIDTLIALSRLLYLEENPSLSFGQAFPINKDRSCPTHQSGLADIPLALL